MDMREMMELRDKVEPLITALVGGVDLFLPIGCEDRKTLQEIVQVLTVGSTLQTGVALSKEVCELAWATAALGYLLGYRKGRDVPVFWVAPEGADSELEVGNGD